jgi:archaemetzincin
MFSTQFMQFSASEISRGEHRCGLRNIYNPRRRCGREISSPSGPQIGEAVHNEGLCGSRQANTYDYEAKQYVAMYILTELMKVDVPADAKILGVTNVDLFVPQSDLSFVFGQAHFGRAGKAALISTLRMDPNSYMGGQPDDKLLIQRMMKEAVHELGHVFGLRNCPDPECVMYLPRDLRSLDKKSDSFCVGSQNEFRALKQSRASIPQKGD